MVVFIGAAFAIAGIGVWLGLSGETRLACGRDQGECVIEQTRGLSTDRQSSS